MASQLTFADVRRRRGRPLTVLPDGARVEEKLAALARTQGIVAGRIACTLAQLERELILEARRAGKCPAPAPPHALRLALREAALSAGPPFVKLRHEPGFARALADLLAALTQGLLDPAQVLALPLPEPVRARVCALAQVLGAAQATLDRAGLVEPHRALRLAIDALAAGGPLPPLVAEASQVDFDAILDWTPLRVRLATVLAGRLPVRVRLPWSGGRADLTAALEPTLRAFERIGDAPAPELVLFDPAAGPLAPFLGRLFGGAADSPSAEPGTPEPLAADSHAPDSRTPDSRTPGQPPPPPPVLLRSCAAPSAQAREVAARCADLLAAGASPDSIAVAVRTLGGGVAEELAAALGRLGIPCRERRGRPALASAPAQLALSLLNLVERDFPLEPLGALLSSRLLWLREEGDHLPGQVLLRILREAHVRDDASEGGVAGRLEALAGRTAAKAVLEGRDETRALAAIDETRRRTKRAIDALTDLPERATLRDHARALLGLLRRWGLSQHLRATLPEDESGGLSRAATAALGHLQAAARALDEACAGLARAALVLGFGDRPFSRADWAQLLAAALSDTSLPPGGARGGAVQLVELRELPGRSFEHVLVAGLVDGELPARPAIDPLLSDEDRRALNRAAGRAVLRAAGDGTEQLLSPPRQAEEPLLFHLGLCAASRSLALFWPRADAQGREVLRSPFVDEAVRALGLADERGLRAELSPIPAAASCRSASELLARVALDVFAEPAFRVSPPPASDGATVALATALAGSPLAPRLSRVSRAAFAERERLRAFIREIPPGRFSGQLSGKALELVQPLVRFDRAAPVSANQLQEHATCGFRTFGHRLLRVERDEEGEDDLAIRERGKLLHRCLEAYFQALRDEGRLPLRGGSAREAELGSLRTIAAREMEAFAREEHVGQRALWELRQTEVLATLVAIVEAEAGQSSQPVEFERRFGFDDPGSWDGLSIPAPDGGDPVIVRGAIDRVDRTATGALTVLDYKSGRIEALRRKLKPETLLAPEFQLAIYAALLLQREPAATPDALYLSMKDATRTRSLAQSVDLAALLEMDPAARARLRAGEPRPPNLADAIFERVGLMRAGAFPVRPLDCDYCDLKPVCRLVALPVDPDENGGEVSRG